MWDGGVAHILGIRHCYTFKGDLDLYTPPVKKLQLKSGIPGSTADNRLERAEKQLSCCTPEFLVLSVHCAYDK